MYLDEKINQSGTKMLYSVKSDYSSFVFEKFSGHNFDLHEKKYSKNNCVMKTTQSITNFMIPKQSKIYNYLEVIIC